MSTFSRRLQVLFSPKDVAKLEELAKKEHKSVGAIIREAVAQYYFRVTTFKKRMKAVKEIGAMKLPVSDWEEMEKEIIEGRLKD